MGVATNLFKEQRHSYSHYIKKFLHWAAYGIIPLALFRLYFHPIFPNSSIDQVPQITLSSSSPYSLSPHHLSLSPSSSSSFRKEKVIASDCDYTDGKWVPSKLAPLYNDSSCGIIKNGQNCIANGRADLGYLYWRWKPKKCSLPRFDPDNFLRLMKNKHLSFVGDSMARNQLESLLCMLASTSTPNLVYRDGEENKFRRWHFPSHNLTVSVYWSPFLVDGIEKSNTGGEPNHNKLYLNRVNERWAADLDDIDVIVFSIGHWYLHPAVYYEGDDSVVLGCHYCPGLNHTEIGFYDVLRKALRTTFQTIIDKRGPTSRSRRNEINVILTTFSPSHFEGEWDKAGACPKTKPYEENEKKLEGMDAEIRSIEMEAVDEANAKVNEKEIVGVRIAGLDVTKLSLMRPDGHPGPYMHPFPFRKGGIQDHRVQVQNDCVHWCLPGPVDTWNQLLLLNIMNTNRWEFQSRRTQ